MTAKVFRWLIYTVIFSLVPIFASYFELIRDTAKLPSWDKVLEHGELYLLAASFSAAGLGEVVGASKKWEIAKVIVGGFSALTLGFGALLFSYVNSAQAQPNDFLISKSVIFFIASCVISTSCIALGDLRDA